MRFSSESLTLNYSSIKGDRNSYTTYTQEIVPAYRSKYEYPGAKSGNEEDQGYSEGNGKCDDYSIASRDIWMVKITDLADRWCLIRDIPWDGLRVAAA